MFRRLLIASLLLVSGVSAAGVVKPTPATKELVYPVTKPIRASPPPAFQPKELTKTKAVLTSMLLAFNSGFTNGACLGGGLLGGKQKMAVAAVTGAWTTSAVGFASGDMAMFSTQIKAIFSYMTGSCMAGLLMPNPKAFKLDDGAGPAFLTGSALLYGASRMAEVSPDAKTCFFLALMANGLQNSLTSVHTANLCRSAHFSGITSDMGTFLGQNLRGNSENLFKLKVFALLGLSFWLGSFSAFFVAEAMGSSTLYLSAALHAVIGLSLLLKDKK